MHALPNIHCSYAEQPPEVVEDNTADIVYHNDAGGYDYNNLGGMDEMSTGMDGGDVSLDMDCGDLVF